MAPVLRPSCRGAETEAGAHVEVDLTVGQDVHTEQLGQTAPVRRGWDVRLRCGAGDGRRVAWDVLFPRCPRRSRLGLIALVAVALLRLLLSVGDGLLLARRVDLDEPTAVLGVMARR